MCHLIINGVVKQIAYHSDGRLPDHLRSEVTVAVVQAVAMQVVTANIPFASGERAPMAPRTTDRRKDDPPVQRKRIGIGKLQPTTKFVVRYADRHMVFAGDKLVKECTQYHVRYSAPRSARKPKYKDLRSGHFRATDIQ
jgi:hypothetical protein